MNKTIILCLMVLIGCSQAPVVESEKNKPQKTLKYGVCTEAEENALEAASRGDLNGLKQYLENGGDPMLECYAYGTLDVPHTPGLQRLYKKVLFKPSYELFSYYLSKDIPSDQLDEYLERFVFSQSDDIVALLLEKNAHIHSLGRDCFLSSQTSLEYLKKFDYDFTWQDNNGDNLLTLYSRCPCDGSENKLIEIIDFLLENDVLVETKNDNGKTAVDKANNEIIRNYLLSKLN